MIMPQPRHSKEEFSRRGRAHYERVIAPTLEPMDAGKFVAIDIETGAFEIHGDDYTATERLLSRKPNAQIWLERIGQRAAYRIGARPEPL
jgi:hypothetical protein